MQQVRRLMKTASPFDVFTEDSDISTLACEAGQLVDVGRQMNVDA